MRIVRTPKEKIRFEARLLDHVFGSSLRARSVVVDRSWQSVAISRGLLWRTSRTIPFSRIRRICHRMYAPIYVDHDVPPRRMESEWSVISLDLVFDPDETLYSEWYRMGSQGRSGRDAVARIQGMVDEIADLTGKPVLIDLEEAEFSVDTEAQAILLSGDMLPPTLKGRRIPFEEVEAVRAVRTPRGYFAVHIVRKDGEEILTTQGYDSTSHLHEIVAIIAARANLPYRLEEVRRPAGPFARGPSSPREYTPLAPSFFGRSARGSPQIGAPGRRRGRLSALFGRPPGSRP